MARRSKASFEKRAREKKKSEKAAMKREARALRGDEPRESDVDVATTEDLAGYGFPVDEPAAPEGDEEDQPPAGAPGPSPARST